ncbi:hypothetical protein M1293_01685 [Candidatus Parvarchaeota archaeon]|nr:hypothetical protein [Candidatus Parvarchaeota archaeon]
MKIVRVDKKNGIIKAIIRSYDDLVVLSYIIEKGDKITAYSRRKITIGDSYEFRTVKISIDVENVVLTENYLDVSGKIYSSSDEDIPLHKYHTIHMKKGIGFVLTKEKVLDFQIRLIERSRLRSPSIFVCSYEEGYAIFYNITNQSLRRVYELKRPVSGKRFKNESRKAFFEELGLALSDEYSKKWDLFIVAGKAMDNEELRTRYLKDKNVIYETVSYADTGLKELMDRDRINVLLKDTKIAAQRNLIKEYVSAVSKGDERYIYGYEKIKEAVSGKQIESAIMTRDFILKNKDVVNSLDNSGAEITFFDEEDESLEQLEGFGGVIVKTH